MATRRSRSWPFLLILLAGAAWALARRMAASTTQVGGQAASEAAPAPNWRPIAQGGVQAGPTPAPAPTWVEPVDGQCPAGYPVKVAASGIFHVPDGRSYDRTTPVRCYADTTAAEADGYRRAKA